MIDQNEVNQKNKQEKLSIRARIEKNLVFFFLTTVVAGFGAGLTFYGTVLGIANMESVAKNSYILKEELAGKILKKEAVREIEHLIEIGEKLNSEEERNIWLFRVFAFIHVIELERDIIWQGEDGWKGQKVSAIEGDILYAFSDSSKNEQVQKILGILQGLKSGIETMGPK